MGNSILSENRRKGRDKSRKRIRSNLEALQADWTGLDGYNVLERKMHREIFAQKLLFFLWQKYDSIRLRCLINGRSIATIHQPLQGILRFVFISDMLYGTFCRPANCFPF